MKQRSAVWKIYAWTILGIGIYGLLPAPLTPISIFRLAISCLSIYGVFVFAYDLKRHFPVFWRCFFPVVLLNDGYTAIQTARVLWPGSPIGIRQVLVVTKAVILMFPLYFALFQLGWSEADTENRTVGLVEKGC